MNKTEPTGEITGKIDANPNPLFCGQRYKNSRLICVEPFPREFLCEGFPGLQSLIEKKVQHDIFLPFEYRRDWVLDEFRFWTEQYLLRAFLTFNSEFEVLLANYYLSCYHEEHLRIAFPDLPRWIGGSFWMRRKSLPELSI